jgi:hypothetical protein
MTDNGKTIFELVRLIGEDKTRLLLFARGGERVYIPSAERLAIDPIHWLTQNIGLNSAIALSKFYSGSDITLPLGMGRMGGLRQRTWAAIRRGIQSGCSTNQLVRMTGVAGRTIRRHRRMLEQEARQPRRVTLFDLFNNNNNNNNNNNS